MADIPRSAPAQAMTALAHDLHQQLAHMSHFDQINVARAVLNLALQKSPQEHRFAHAGISVRVLYGVMLGVDPDMIEVATTIRSAPIKGD